MLKEVRSALPPDLAQDLQTSWKLVVSFGHVNPGTVWLSKLDGSVVGDPARHSVTFDGPHNGPLQQQAIAHMGMIYTALAESAVRAFAASFNQRLTQEWSSAFTAQMARVVARQTERPAP